MAIDTLYVPLFTIEEVILDKDTGLPLAAGVVTFYRDSQRTQPKSVFQISGSSPNYTFVDVGNTLVLGLSGTFVDGNGDPFVPYAYPYDSQGDIDLYYVTVESEGAVDQFVRQAVPYVNTQSSPPSDRTNTDNELCNPQFVEVLFPAEGVTLNVTGSNTITNIAPGWDLLSSGSGTVVLERLEPTSANVVTNPPYALSINASSGLGAGVILRQRLNNSPSIMRNGFASATLTVAVLSGGASDISMVYAPSTGASTTIIPSTAISTDGAYHVIANNAAIPDQVNDPASIGYVDINIVLPTSRTIAITSIQVVAVSESVDLAFDEQSSDAQKDHLFHYYENGVVRQPKTNLLTGWTFGLNPWQSYSVTHGNVATNEYTADQTIIIQQQYVNAASGNNVSVVQGSIAQNYGYLLTAVTATNKFGMLQYIDPATIRPYWGQTLSVRIKLSVILGSGHTTIPRFKLRLMYKAGLPSTLSQTDPISAWTDTDDSIPALNGWTYITAINDPTYVITSTPSNFNFDGFILPASSNANMTLGVMLVMMNDLDSTGTADKILIDRVSLVHNDFAIDASPETYDESLRKCQYYYEKSYDVGDLPGTATFNGVINFPGVVYNSTTATLYPGNFNINFKAVKRVAPVINIFAKDGTADTIQTGMRVGSSYPAPTAGVNPRNTTTSGTTIWNAGAISTSSAFYSVSNATGIFVVSSIQAGGYAESLLHYVANSRLGS